ncbi:MAG: hypothetical protein U9R19_04240 [Bacteroidota bacterium]|nr:hypothetical protein [Bacteroidota bacterium]
MDRYKVFIILILLGISFSGVAQEENLPDFIYQNKLYKTGSSWFTIGSGIGYFPAFDKQQKNFSVDLNSRWKKHYFALGFHYDGDEFITVRSGQRCFEFHAGYGLRSENLKRNLYAYIGPSYALGYVFDHSESLITANAVYETKKYRAFNVPGIYGEARYVQKIFYDIGVGMGLYASANKYYQIIGIRLFLYFSTAYITKV